MPAGFGFVVNERNEVLLIQRGYGKQKGQWSLPGGNRDGGESLRETAVRETREETGIRMTAADLYYSERHRFEYRVGDALADACEFRRRSAWTLRGSARICYSMMTIWPLARTGGPLSSGRARIPVVAGCTIPALGWSQRALVLW